jgi:hypothetical protein
MEQSRPRCDLFARTFADASAASGVAWRINQTVNARARIRRSYCCPTAVKSPSFVLMILTFMRDLQAKKKADERTRTADRTSLRVRFGPLYLSRKVAHLDEKVSAACRRVTLHYDQVSVR